MNLLVLVSCSGPKLFSLHVCFERDLSADHFWNLFLVTINVTRRRIVRITPLTVNKLPHDYSYSSENIKPDKKAAIHLFIAIEALLQIFLLRQLLKEDTFSSLSSICYLHVLF